MSYRIHFAPFSKAVNGFVSTTKEADLDLFTSENSSFMDKDYEFSQSARLQTSLFTQQKYGKNAVESIITSGQEFRIISLKAIEKEWDNIMSFIALSSASIPDDEKELFLEVRNQVEALLNASEEAIKRWKEKACLLIW